MIALDSALHPASSNWGCGRGFRIGLKRGFCCKSIGWQGTSSPSLFHHKFPFLFRYLRSQRSPLLADVLPDFPVPVVALFALGTRRRQLPGWHREAAAGPQLNFGTGRSA